MGLPVLLRARVHHPMFLLSVNFTQGMATLYHLLRGIHGFEYC